MNTWWHGNRPGMWMCLRAELRGKFWTPARDFEHFIIYVIENRKFGEIFLAHELGLEAEADGIFKWYLLGNFDCCSYFLFGLKDYYFD